LAPLKTKFKPWKAFLIKIRDQFSSDVSIAAGIPHDELVLSVAGRRLEDGRRFDYYNFQSDDNIYLYQRVRAIEGNAGSYELPTILLHVATSAGHTYSFALLPTSTVGDVMRKIQTLENIPPHEQRLVHYDQVMDSGCTLAHYCVRRTVTRSQGTRKKMADRDCHPIPRKSHRQ
jgi:hypothetical protein